MGITNRGLAKIAALGGIFALGSAGYFQWKISKNIKQSEYFRLAFDALNESEAVVGFLGKPILFGNINLGDTQKNFCDGLQAKFHVPVRGPSHSGLMVFEASRDSIEQKWHLDYLELQDKDATKKLTVRRKTSHTLEGDYKMWSLMSNGDGAGVMRSVQGCIRQGSSLCIPLQSG